MPSTMNDINETTTPAAGAEAAPAPHDLPQTPAAAPSPETQLAETVFHALAHATLWVPGSVDFNE